jgi:hypothetical protein
VTAVNPYPIATPQRRRIVQSLGELARELDAEVEARVEFGGGVWNDMVITELRRAAGTIRFVATLVVNGSMPTPTALFSLTSAKAYLALVRRADLAGVIR